jgi:hypothetical protein
MAMSYFHRGAKQGSVRFALALGVIAGSLLLAGCSPALTTGGSISTSQSGTPQAVDPNAAPKTEAQAIVAARAAIDRELAVMVAVNVAGGLDLAPLSTVAIGPELVALRQSGRMVAEQKWTVTGTLSFEYQSGRASDLVGADGTKYPFSSVTVRGCQDASKYNATLPDGSIPQRSPSLRFINELTVIRDTESKTWLVHTVERVEDAC